MGKNNPLSNPSPPCGEQEFGGSSRMFNICRINSPGEKQFPPQTGYCLSISQVYFKKRNLDTGYPLTFQVNFHSWCCVILVQSLITFGTLWFWLSSCSPPTAALNHELLVILVHREWRGLFADQMLGARMGRSKDSDVNRYPDLWGFWCIHYIIII